MRIVVIVLLFASVTVSRRGKPVYIREECVSQLILPFLESVERAVTKVSQGLHFCAWIYNAWVKYIILDLLVNIKKNNYY